MPMRLLSLRALLAGFLLAGPLLAGPPTAAAQDKAAVQGNVYDPLRESWRVSRLLGAEVRMLDDFAVGNLADLVFDTEGLVHSAVIELEARAGFTVGYIEVLHSVLRFEPERRLVYLAMERNTVETAGRLGDTAEVVLGASPGRWLASRLMESTVFLRGSGIAPTRGRVADLLLSPSAHQLAGFILDTEGRRLYAVPLDQSWHLFDQDFIELATDLRMETALPLFLFR